MKLPVSVYVVRSADGKRRRQKLCETIVDGADLDRIRAEARRRMQADGRVLQGMSFTQDARTGGVAGLSVTVQAREGEMQA